MRVLQIVHGFPPAGSGGAELYAEALATSLTRSFGDDVAVFTRESLPSAPELRVRDERRDGLLVRFVNNTFRETRTFADTYVNPRITALASQFVDEVRPDVAHVHHLTCLSTTIVDVLAERGIPVVLTLHDYWLLCHRGQLLDRELRRCDGPGESGCASCIGLEGSLPASAGAVSGAVRAVARALPLRLASPVRRAAGRVAAELSSADRAQEASRARTAHMKERLARVTLLLAPSVHVRDLFARAGVAADRIVVSEYGVPSARPGQPSRPGDPLRIAFLGSLLPSKAPHLIVDALAGLPPGRVRVSIYGAPAPYHGDDSYAAALPARLVHPDVMVKGPIPHADVPSVLAGTDVLVVPSIWEETSGIGAREALAAGVPVLASRIGGLPAAILDEVNGLLFEPGQAGDLGRQLRRLIDEPGLLDRLRAGVRPPRSLADDVSATRALYESLVSARQAAALPTAPRVPSVTAVVLNYRTPDQSALAARMLAMSEHPLAEIVVVDNGDGRACRAALETAAVDARVIATGANTGFPAGCNVGLRHAFANGADLVLLVNSDALVPPDCVTRLVEAWQARPAAGIVAPVLRGRSAPGIVSSAGLDYDLRTGRLTHRRDPGGAVPPRAVSGCVMLVSRALVDAIGALPEEYFFSFEDVDFCLRARAAGFDVVVASASTAYHDEGGTLGPGPERLYYAARNHLRLGARTPARSRLHRAARQWAIAGYNLAHAVTAHGGGFPTRELAVLRGIADHVRGRYGPAAGT